MSSFKSKNVIVGVTASIAAYKSAFLVREFVKQGANVRVIQTPESQQFITPLTLSTLSKNPVLSGLVKEDDKDGYLITPSGKKYETLKPEDIVFMSLNEETEKNDSGNKPSSEWRFHRDIYVDKKNAQAIVHAHSPHATAVSSHGKTIPPFHYMVALAGGEDIKCAEYATFGTEELSKNVLKALHDLSLIHI